MFETFPYNIWQCFYRGRNEWLQIYLNTIPFELPILFSLMCIGYASKKKYFIKTKKRNGELHANTKNEYTVNSDNPRMVQNPSGSSSKDAGVLTTENEYS